MIASPADASAWNPEQWHGELISGYVQTSADTAINDFGDRIDLAVFSKRISQNYGTLGLTDRIALVAKFDWQDTEIVEPGIRIAFSKPSSISAGLQYQLTRREGHATAISISYLDGIDLPSQLLTLEGRDPSLEIRALWGESRTLAGIIMFAELQAASQFRLGDGYGATRFQLTIGGDPTERTKILGKLRYVNQEPGVFERLDIARQIRWETEISGVYQLRKRDFIEIGYTGVLSGRNAVLETGYKIGYWRKF